MWSPSSSLAAAACSAPSRRTGAGLPVRDVLLRDLLRSELDVPPRLEFDEARARWRELATEDAGLGPIAAFHEERLASLAAAPAPDIALDLTPDAAARAIAEGRPLLGEGALTC